MLRLRVPRREDYGCNELARWIGTHKDLLGRELGVLGAGAETEFLEGLRLGLRGGFGAIGEGFVLLMGVHDGLWACRLKLFGASVIFGGVFTVTVIVVPATSGRFCGLSACGLVESELLPEVWWWREVLRYEGRFSAKRFRHFCCWWWGSLDGMWLDLDLAIGEKSCAPWRACLEKMYWCGAGGSPGEDTLARLVHFYRQRVSMYVCCSAHELTFGARENSGKSKGGRQRKPPRAPTPTAMLLPRKHKDRHENQNQTFHPDQAGRFPTGSRSHPMLQQHGHSRPRSRRGDHPPSSGIPHEEGLGVLTSERQLEGLWVAYCEWSRAGGEGGWDVGRNGKCAWPHRLCLTI